ncbi:NYN domain-containing protein [Bradyrhizobium sp. CCBAU 11357]|uniref:NYN domain-containing protein n=1 Tax=Bradyrhizobium sp. CCBAU 11357 TaxID=1630808 RepID=UPI003FA42CF1
MQRTVGPYTNIARRHRYVSFRSGGRHQPVRLGRDAARLAKHFDEVILLSGDSDFHPLVASLQRRGVRITDISSIAYQSPMIADDLRRQADAFVDLTELQACEGRLPSKFAFALPSGTGVRRSLCGSARLIDGDTRRRRSDWAQLANMAKQAKAVLKSETLEAVTDRGYFNRPEILACRHHGNSTQTPDVGRQVGGRLGKQDFAYLSVEDAYRCPAGERLRYRYTSEEDGKILRR